MAKDDTAAATPDRGPEINLLLAAANILVPLYPSLRPLIEAVEPGAVTAATPPAAAADAAAEPAVVTTGEPAPGAAAVVPDQTIPAPEKPADLASASDAVALAPAEAPAIAPADVTGPKVDPAPVNITSND